MIGHYIVSMWVCLRVWPREEDEHQQHIYWAIWNRQGAQIVFWEDAGNSKSNSLLHVLGAGWDWQYMRLLVKLSVLEELWTH